PGCGRSEGRKGHIDRFDVYLEAVGQWVEETRQENAENKPLFLLGHSLGGLIATRFVQRYPDRHALAGLILSSPLFQLKLDVPGWKLRLAGTL
ncbi:alpha/beta fold hydrolase, partial [Salmonella enterica]|uniref:alpha/beta fold hydrolase n=1 Tax=Salmonella enterica TaxID=28901 RepID=UPI0022B64358